MKLNHFKNKELCSAGCWVRSGITYRDESGRSMVEMLGVLAIMGILSVVGIAGFKNAMDKS
ncbi:MAG: hypothetical protein ACI4OR_04965, partial [Alphaproteobacteria bacterium]